MRTMKVSTKTKGIIAAVAGGTLLLGSGATFALWSDDATLEGTTITSGSLSVTADGFKWTFTGPGAPASGVGVVDSSFLMIPGHTVTGTGTITPELLGTGLTAELTATGGETPGDGGLASHATITWTLNGNPIGTGASVILPAAVEAAGAVEQTLVVTIQDLEPVAESQNLTWSVANLDVTLTQTLP